MMDDQAVLGITGGMDVVGSDGQKLGTVDHTEGNYIVASKGMLFPTDYYIPVDAVSNVDEDRVYLNVTKEMALDQGWNTMPTETASTATMYGDDTSISATSDPGVVDSSGTALERADVEPFEHQSHLAGSHIHGTETITVPLSEEELTATTRPVDRGAVQIEKAVVEEERTVEVPVTEERVNVTRRPVDRPVDPDTVLFEGGTIQVPVRGEDVDIHREARVREEIEITKEAVTETQQVTDTVRREEVRIVEDTSSAASGASDSVTSDGPETVSDEAASTWPEQPS